MTNSNGEGAFSAYLSKDRPLGEVVFGPGLEDTQGAEIHLVVRTHGAADTSKLYTQLSTFEPHPALGGTCEACQDHQFAVHQPSEVIASN